MKKRALGKGLNALIPKVDDIIEIEKKRGVQEIPIDQVQPNPYQPRHQFNSQTIQQMAESIRTSGLLQPIVVRRVDDAYQLVSGERRLRAARVAELDRIPALVVEASDNEVLEFALIENLQREDLNPIDEAKAYKTLAQLFRLTQDEIAKRVGKDRSSVANTLRLLSLPLEMQKDVEEGRLTPGHARAILSLENLSQQRQLRSFILARELSVRDAERQARRIAEGRRTKKGGASPQRDPHLAELEERLLARLGTRVRISPSSKTKGKIEIHYSSLEEIYRILSIIGLESL
jgi:ParB family chromosome partitioning protein